MQRYAETPAAAARNAPQPGGGFENPTRVRGVLLFLLDSLGFPGRGAPRPERLLDACRCPTARRIPCYSFRIPWDSLGAERPVPNGSLMHAVARRPDEFLVIPFVFLGIPWARRRLVQGPTVGASRRPPGAQEGAKTEAKSAPDSGPFRAFVGFKYSAVCSLDLGEFWSSNFCRLVNR